MTYSFFELSQAKSWALCTLNNYDNIMDLSKCKKC